MKTSVNPEEATELFNNNIPLFIKVGNEYHQITLAGALAMHLNAENVVYKTKQL